MCPAARLVDHHCQLFAHARDGEKSRRGNDGRRVGIGFGGLGCRRARSGELCATAYSGLALALFLIECAPGIDFQQFLNRLGNRLAQAGDVHSSADHHVLCRHR
ncbi:hypothetical protein HMPREF3069_01825 [Achromobacter xylosoxidans]|nr:hypothetical protein HMPREF3069_01825 [Achromobacter xylosoxidans]RSF01834.1 hypothetical protein EGU54_14645 [Achromobacter aegrifaciens]